MVRSWRLSEVLVHKWPWSRDNLYLWPWIHSTKQKKNFIFRASGNFQLKFKHKCTFRRPRCRGSFSSSGCFLNESLPTRFCCSRTSTSHHSWDSLIIPNMLVGALQTSETRHGIYELILRPILSWWERSNSENLCPFWAPKLFPREASGKKPDSQHLYYMTVSSTSGRSVNIYEYSFLPRHLLQRQVLGWL